MDPAAPPSKEGLSRWISGELTLREICGVPTQKLEELATLAAKWVELARYDDARMAFEGIIALEPRHAYSWSALGAVYLAEEQVGQAGRCCSYALSLDPEN